MHNFDQHNGWHVGFEQLSRQDCKLKDDLGAIDLENYFDWYKINDIQRSHFAKIEFIGAAKNICMVFKLVLNIYVSNL